MVTVTEALMAGQAGMSALILSDVGLALVTIDAVNSRLPRSR